LEDFHMHMRALEALGKPVSHMGTILCPLIREAIPTPLLLEWNRQTHGKCDEDLDKLLDFIQIELEGIELTERAKQESTTAKEKRPNENLGYGAAERRAPLSQNHCFCIVGNRRRKGKNKKSSSHEQWGAQTLLFILRRSAFHNSV